MCSYTRWFFCLKEMKLASTTGKMFSTLLFSFCCPIMCHLCNKNLVYTIEFSSNLLNFQSRVYFSLLMIFFSQFCLTIKPFLLYKTFPRLWIQFSWHERPITKRWIDFQLFYDHLPVKWKKWGFVFYKLIKEGLHCYV